MSGNSSTYRLRNHMEDIVAKRLDDVINKMDICKCGKCRMDIMAYTLNLLSPKYVVTDEGDLYSRVSEFNTQFVIDVDLALMEAIKVVSNNPKH